MSFLIIIQIFALLMIILAICGLAYEVNCVNDICQSIPTSKSEKKFWTMILTTKIVHFLHPCVRVFEYRSWNTHSYFRKAKIFKIPFSLLPDFLFTPQQLSVHLRQEAMHYWKHLTGQHQLRFFPSTQNSSVKSWCAHFFPHLANIWRWHIELLLLHVSNSSSFCFLE